MVVLTGTRIVMSSFQFPQRRLRALTRQVRSDLTHRVWILACRNEIEPSRCE